METEKVKKLQTPCAEIYYKDDILYQHFKFQNTSVMDAKEHIQMIKDHLYPGTPMLIIIDLRQSKQLSKEVRAYFGSDEVSELVKSAAMIVGSGLSRIIGNLFIKFSNPDFPIKIFTDQNKAENWLRST